MKIYITFFLALFIIISPLSFCLADDSGEDHICFTRIDTNQDDNATFQEFEKFYGNDPEKYQTIDQNKDGKVSHDEYEEYLSNQEE
jgi:hypothetical protein